MDATPFSGVKVASLSGKSDKPSGTLVDEYGEVLRDHGFNYHGTEVMYSGLFGTELVCEIFIGVVYYQRLRHMVSDKYQVKKQNSHPSFVLETRTYSN